MRKKISLFSIVVSILLFININFSGFTASADELIYLGGMPAGFSLVTRGAEVVGVCDVVTPSGVTSPAKENDLRIGDIILCIDGQETNSAIDIEKHIKNKNSINLTIKRSNEIFYKTLKPSKDVNNENKLGVFIRDGISGIGTITYVKGNKFASLGHPIIDDNNDVLDIISGKLYPCNITGYIKGEKGKAGELRGVFLRQKEIGIITLNKNCGVFGTMSDVYKNDLEPIGVGEAVPGNACIYSTILGDSPRKYDISIIKSDNLSECKNFVIKITDKLLIDSTGGIVQGMSGSPIVQNNKLVGAVTHVFINDPTRGFGININKMLINS